MRVKTALRSPTARVIATIGAVWLVLTGLVMVAYLLTALLYAGLRWQPPALAAQLINTLLGFGLLGTLMFGVGRLFRHEQHRWFGPLVEAMDRIANPRAPGRRPEPGDAPALSEHHPDREHAPVEAER